MCSGSTGVLSQDQVQMGKVKKDQRGKVERLDYAWSRIIIMSCTISGVTRNRKEAVDTNMDSSSGNAMRNGDEGKRLKRVRLDHNINMFPRLEFIEEGNYNHFKVDA